jgi:hypothetical protein
LTRAPRFGRATAAIAFLVALAWPITAAVQESQRRRELLAARERPELRVVLEWDAHQSRNVRRFEGNEVDDDAELGARLREARDVLAARGVKSVPVVILPGAGVEKGAIRRVQSVAQSSGFDWVGIQYCAGGFCSASAPAAR